MATTLRATAASLLLLLPLAAGACGTGPRPTGELEPGRFRFVPDSAGPGRGRGCGWHVREAFDVVPLDAEPPAGQALGDSAIAYAELLGRRLGDLIAHSDTTALRRAVAEWTITAGGSVESVELRVPSGDAEYDGSLLLHLRNSELVGLVPSLPIGIQKLRLAVGAGRRATLDQAHLSRSHVCPAAPLDRSTVANPVALRHLGEVTGLRGRTAAVLVQFVIDTTGRAALATFQVLKSPHTALEPPAREVVEASRYRPAERDGRKVPQLVQQPLSFAFPP